ncbi:hypothetical protein Cni_G03245 [Canna indica]|uniref:DUF4005 domain-containing protein n=1 Tax=Canna indica TaxID=4628 RepID=A0AAQ3JTJ9_9LILI|nr:hypothetical protein Cni_G03245 [Canna indica]
MGKKSSWLSIFKRAFTSSSNEKFVDTSISIQGSENKLTREKKKWGFGKSKHSEINSFIPLHRQPSSIEEILEDAGNEQQHHRMHQVIPKKVQQSKSPARKPRIIPNYAHLAAIKIQAAYRGYRARRSYRALKGLMRLQRVMRGPSVKRQTTNTLRYMHTLVRVQLQIRDRRLQMVESRSLQLHQTPRKNEETGSNFGRWSVAHQTEAERFEEWDDSVLTKEEMEARMQRKVEAVIRRERALAYAYTHQLLKVTPRSAEAMLTDLRTGRAPWWWAWLESQLPSNFAGAAPTPPIQTPRPQTPRYNSQMPRPQTPRSAAPAAGGRFKAASVACRPHRRYYSRLKPEDADDASLTSCPPFAVPNYMAPTVSAQAKARGHRTFTAVPEPKKKRFSLGLSQSIGSLFTGKETTGSGGDGGGCGARSMRRQGRHRSTPSVGGMSIESIVSLPVGAVAGSGRNRSFM